MSTVIFDSYNSKKKEAHPPALYLSLSVACEHIYWSLRILEMYSYIFKKYY